MFPILQGSYNGKLVFALCRKCAEQKIQAYCEHDGAERYLKGTWCTPELHDAVEHVYEVVQIHEVWHWERRREKFFVEHIGKFLAIKM